MCVWVWSCVCVCACVCVRVCVCVCVSVCLSEVCVGGAVQRAWLVARSQTLAVLSAEPVYTRAPSAGDECKRVGR